MLTTLLGRCTRSQSTIPVPLVYPVYENIRCRIESLKGLKIYVPELAFKPNSLRLQYLSDVHVDCNKLLPKIEPVSETLALCGDIGKPTHPNFDSFLKYVSSQFDQIYFVPGNHDYDCGPFYDSAKILRYEQLLHDICSKYPNITILNNSFATHGDNTIIAGTTLWCNPVLRPNITYDIKKYHEHIKIHNRDVEWIKKLCERYQDKNIVMLSHFVPTYKLIEPKYLERGIHKVSTFATDLEYLIKNPIVAWLCGHTHSVSQTYVNNIFCAVNAWGYPSEVSKNIVPVKYIDIYDT